MAQAKIYKKRAEILNGLDESQQSKLDKKLRTGERKLIKKSAVSKASQWGAKAGGYGATGASVAMATGHLKPYKAGGDYATNMIVTAFGAGAASGLIAGAAGAASGAIGEYKEVRDLHNQLTMGVPVSRIPMTVANNRRIAAYMDDSNVKTKARNLAFRNAERGVVKY